MHPGQPAGHAGAGLVEADHRGVGELRLDRGDKPVQPSRALGQDLRKRAGGDRGAEHVGQQLRGPVDRQVLVDAQVGDQAAQPRPLADRPARGH
jgi:hypothetical protein